MHEHTHACTPHAGGEMDIFKIPMHTRQSGCERSAKSSLFCLSSFHALSRSFCVGPARKTVRLRFEQNSEFPSLLAQALLDIYRAQSFLELFRSSMTLARRRTRNNAVHHPARPRLSSLLVRSPSFTCARVSSCFSVFSRLLFLSIFSFASLFFTSSCRCRRSRRPSVLGRQRGPQSAFSAIRRDRRRRCKR